MKKEKLILLGQDTVVKDSTMKKNIWIRVGSHVFNSSIESDVFIGFHCHIENSEIGNSVEVASKTIIGGQSKKTIIGKYTWIGAGVRILEGVEIGEGCIIGANSIIDEDISPYTIVYGNDRLIKRKRLFIGDGTPNFKDLLKQMIEKKKQNKYLNKNSEGNYISASIVSKSKFQIGKNNIFIGSQEFNGGIYLDENVVLKNNIIFEAAGKIYIGKDSQIEDNVHILSTSHDYNYLSLPMTLLPVRIGNNVHIGKNSTILGGITISDNSIIEENSFVIKNI